MYHHETGGRLWRSTSALGRAWSAAVAIWTATGESRRLARGPWDTRSIEVAGDGGTV